MDAEETLYVGVETEKKLLQSIENVLHLIQDDKFWSEFGCILEKTYPGIKESLMDRIQDLEKRDCGIVVAGETSCGKSTLINKLIGSDTLPGDVLETTTKIYRIKHSETIKVQTFKHGCQKAIDHPCNSLEELQSMLEDFEDEVKRDDTICQVDVYMPFSKIQRGNVVLVDTPGIGDSNHLRQILEEYIPKAVAFVFIVDVSRAGGLQKDRLLPILSTIKSNAGDMQCFDFEDTLFVRNKWDCVDDDKKKREKIKIKLNKRIKEEWPCVKENHIFDTCLKQKSNNAEDIIEYNTQFENLEDSIGDLIKKKENIRIQTHGNYLKSVIEEVTAILSEGQAVKKRRKEANDTSHENFNGKRIRIGQLIKNMEKKENEDKIVADILKNLVDKLNSYVNSEEFSTQILQETPHINTFSKTQIDREIHRRMKNAVTLWLNINVPKTVISEFDNIIQGNTDGHEKMIDVFQNSGGVSTFDNDEILGLQEALWTAASSVAWVGYSVAIVGPLLPGILTGLGLLKAVSVGIRYVSNILPEADAIIKHSFDTRVESVDKESLKTLFVQHYDNPLRKFYRDILKEHLPAVDKSLSFALEEMRKDANRLDEEHNINKEMSLHICRFQEEVVKLLESADKERPRV